jgi:hypothetical protein
MATTHAYSARRALVARAIASALVSLLAVAGTTAQASSSGDGCIGTYGWPVKPFDRQHPIRGNFGDPRTGFWGPYSEHTLLEGGGSFSFHQGVDISAPDGSPVYAVASGKVTRARGRVTVSCGNGRSFEYWHIDPTVRLGDHAVAGKTLLGFIQPKREHVHLTQLDRGRAVNPLAAGHLSPYRDTTSPDVLGIAIWRDELGREPLGRHLSGRVYLVAEATDTPALPVPGRWHGYPVTPALVTWRIESSDGGVVVQGVARDVRSTVPRNDRFWHTFARGTCSNWPTYDHVKQQGMTGKYLFWLTRKPFDSTKLAPGKYGLVVVAEDTAGNRDERRLSFYVDPSTD